MPFQLSTLSGISFAELFAAPARFFIAFNVCNGFSMSMITHSGRRGFLFGILFLFVLQGCSGLRPVVQPEYSTHSQTRYVPPATPVKNKKDDRLGLLIVAGFGA